MTSRTASLIAGLLLPVTAFAAEQTFDFKDPKGVNSAIFKLDAPLESITGSAKGITGTLTVDPAKPESAKGSIVIDTSTLRVENETMQQHMHGEQWMDVSNHKEIKFTLTGLKDVKTEKDVTSGTATGKLSIKGVEKEISVPASVTLLKGKLAARTPGKEGDLAVLRTTFKIKRTDYNINPKAPSDKVADEIEISLAIAGASPKK